MPIPLEVIRQDGDRSCGYHAIANAVNLMDDGVVVTPKSLMHGPEAKVEMLSFATTNNVLAENNLHYQAVKPKDGTSVLPLDRALGEGVYIAKANMKKTDVATGEVTNAKHAIVITGFKPHETNNYLDSWTVLDSALGSAFSLTRSENNKYAYLIGKANVEMTIEGVLKLEKATTAGGLQPAKSSWFRDMLSCCGCFQKTKAG